MTTGTCQNVLQVDKLTFFTDNEHIREVDNHTVIGVIIYKTLSWDKQIDAVCLNITRRITLMKLLSKYVDASSLNQYYSSYILPIFYYGCMFWGRCTAANNNRLIKLQKRATRIVLQADILTLSQTMFKELKWLDFPKRVQYHTCILIHQALNGMAPEYIQDLFSKSSEIHNRNLRSVEKDMLRIPYSRTFYYERSFAIDGAKQ